MKSQFATAAEHGVDQSANEQAAGLAGASDVVGTEFHHFLADVQDLVRQVAHDADPVVVQLRAKVETAMASIKDTIADSREQIKQQARTVLHRGDGYVRDQPWQAVGIAALVGVALGVVIARR
jgi:ElaB/YqjD/DUF883 family membrane-anchored ribosome-binding protein